MRGDLVDAGPGPAAAALEQVRRSGQPGGKLGQHRLVALPVLADHVAEAIVELEPAGREVADLVAAGTDVPGLGDQLDAAEHPVLPDRAEEAGMGIEAVLLAPERRREVEAEAVDVHLLDPVAQGIRDHLQDAGMAHVDGVAGAGIVDVVARIVGQEPVVGGVVDASERQRRAEMIALGGVVVDHVQDHLDAGVVEPLDHGLELADRAARQIAGLGREEADGVVAPVVGEALREQAAVLDEGMDRQQLDRGDAELDQVVDDRPDGPARRRCRADARARPGGAWSCRARGSRR